MHAARPAPQFDWCIPIDGDGVRLGTRQAERPPTFDYLRGFCRKVRFFGQNPKIEYQEFNELQILKRSKKQLCDIYGRAASVKGRSNCDTKEGRCRHLAGL
jgi:hypothetical protein